MFSGNLNLHVFCLQVAIKSLEPAVPLKDAQEEYNALITMAAAEARHVVKLGGLGIMTTSGMNAYDYAFPCFVMERGVVNLHEFVRCCPKAQMAERDVCRLLFQVCSGLHELHSKDIWHRDLSPANVVLFPEAVGYPTAIVAANPPADYPNSFRAKLVDLGASRRLDGLNTGVKPTAVCTPGYAAPEYETLSNGTLPANKFDWVRADIWSVGCLGLFAARGRNPPWASMPSQNRVPHCKGCSSWQCVSFKGGPEVKALLQQCSVFSSWSSEGLDALAACLQWDPVQRPAAGQMMGQSWFAGECIALLEAADRGERVGGSLELLLTGWR